MRNPSSWKFNYFKRISGLEISYKMWLALSSTPYVTLIFSNSLMESRYGHIKANILQEPKYPY